jgi:hypothetical protein
MPKHKTIKISPREEAVSYGYFAGFVGFLLAYFVSEASLYGRPHPLHWLASFSAAALTGVVTYQIVLRRRSNRS